MANDVLYMKYETTLQIIWLQAVYDERWNFIRFYSDRKLLELHIFSFILN